MAAAAVGASWWAWQTKMGVDAEGEAVGEVVVAAVVPVPVMGAADMKAEWTHQRERLRATFAN
jgi:hypothetical protein